MFANSKVPKQLVWCQAFDISKGDIGFERQKGEVWRSCAWRLEYLWFIHVTLCKAALE